MAVVPARAWSAVGVTSLKALQAPFLFESDEHVAAVVNDAAITKDLFSGFDGSGVTGLTLFPESLRHLFSFGEPMLTPADVKGRTIRAISSIETTAIIEALGGMAVDPVGDAYQQGIDAGTIQGTDSGFPLSSGRPQRHLDGDRQRRPVREGHDPRHQQHAVDQPRRRPAGDHHDGIGRDPGMGYRQPGEGRRRRGHFCAGGGTVVLTDAASVAAFRAAEAPVYAALEADPATKRAIAAIKARGRRGSLGRPSRRASRATAASTFLPDWRRPAERNLPSRVHRRNISRSWGLGVSDIKFNHGIWTYTLEDGHWTIDQLADDVTSHVAGVYRVEGRDLYWRWDNDPCRPWSI